MPFIGGTIPFSTPFRQASEYVVVGSIDGKAQDIKIEGIAVAALINQLREWNGVPKFDKRGLTKAVGGF